MDTEPRDALARTFATARIVYGTMLASLFVYAAVVQFLFANGLGKEPGDGRALFRYLFYGLAVMTLLSVRFVRQMLLNLGGTQRPPEQRLLTAQVVTGALLEAAGLYGLLLYLVAGFHLDALVLLALSAVLMVLYWPRLSSWESFASEKRRETGRA